MARALLGINWTPERKKAFEELARSHGMTPTEFGREILESALRALLPEQQLRAIGLAAPWEAQARRSSPLLDYLVQQSRKEPAEAFPDASKKRKEFPDKRKRTG